MPGVAYALTGLLRAFPWHARRGQVYLPADSSPGTASPATTSSRGRGGPGLLGALADLRGVARRHLAQARTLTRRRIAARRRRRPSVPLALVEPYLRHMERRGYDPFRTVVDLPRWRRIGRAGARASS